MQFVHYVVNRRYKADFNSILCGIPADYHVIIIDSSNKVTKHKNFRR